MELIADILLVAGAIGAGVYCYVLARRLSRFNDLEKGVGGAVAVLSAQVDDLNKSLLAAQHTTGMSHDTLADLTARAEAVSQKMELMMASMHDLPDTQATQVNGQAVQPSNPPQATKPGEPMFVRHARSGSGAN